MKPMKQIIVTLMMVLLPAMAMAQPQGQGKDAPRFDPQKFQQMVEQTLTKAGGLTADEAKAFFPLYNKMREEQRAKGKQIHELKQSAPADTKAYSSTIMRIKKLQVETAELEHDYYKRFQRVVPPEKLFKMMQAEDDFHRRMVQGRGNKRGKSRSDAPQAGKQGGEGHIQQQSPHHVGQGEHRGSGKR